MAPKDFSEATRRLQQEIDNIGSRDRPVADSGPASRIRSVQSQIEAIGRGDLEAVLVQALPDVRLDIFAPPEFDWIRQAHGIDELRQALEQNFSSVEDQRPQISNVFTEGDTVVLFGREQGRIRGTGRPYDVEFVEKFTFRDDRLSAVHIVVAAHLPNPGPA